MNNLFKNANQFCQIDPEGDYDSFRDALSFGSAKEPPDSRAVLRALEFPRQSVIVNLLGVLLPIAPDALPAFFR